MEFSLDFGPLHIRLCIDDVSQDGEEYVEVTSDTERVDYPPDTEVDWIGFRPS